MSNIYEALEQAQRQKADPEIQSMISALGKGAETKAVPFPEQPAIGKTAEVSDPLSLDEEMFSLYQSIDCLLPNVSQKTILFIGPQGGEGVSTIVREFARMAAARTGKTVLVMDAAHHNPSQHIHFDIKGRYGWKDVVHNGEPVDKACHKSGDANVFLSPMYSQVYDHYAAISFLEELHDKFDLILIDSSPAITSPDSIAISRFTDGVVLVMEAERTRQHVLESVKSKIERNGGKVLGIIFNKRKFYIPDFIYKLMR